MQTWDNFYNRVVSFDDYINTPHIKYFMRRVLEYWSGGKILEVGTGTGYMAVWLSRLFPAIDVTAMDNNEELLKRAELINNSLKGNVTFCKGDAFNLEYLFQGEQFDVIFHQGLLEHFSNEEIVQLIEQQLQISCYAVFSVPSKFYPQVDFGNERLMEREDWIGILTPLNSSIIYCEYYSHELNANGNEELCIVLEGKIKRDQKEIIHQVPKFTPPVQLTSVKKPEIVWRSFIFHHSGYAQHARNIVLGMEKCGIRVCLDPMTHYLEGDFDASTWERLARMVQQKPFSPAPMVFLHPPVGHKGEDFFYEARKLYPHMTRYIGSSFFETDRIPETWVASCNAMDEIWVPNQFNFETFNKSGVARDKIHIIPSGINTELFKPDMQEKVTLPGNKSFNFISIFEWTKRKGWDILLEAFLKEFDYREDVGLILFVYRGSGTSKNDAETATQKASHFMIQELSIDPTHIASVNVVESVFPNYIMPMIYNAADAFVLPSRGEGWGMPYMEAMTLGIPSIGTRWGGNLTFMTDENSYLIDIEGLEPVDEEQVRDNAYYQGHYWAKPSVASTRKCLREVFENRKTAREKALKGQDGILHNWTMYHAGKKILERLQEIETEKNQHLRTRKIFKSVDQSVQVVWNSPIADPSGYAEESRNIILGLDKHTSLNLKINPLKWNDLKVRIDRTKEEIFRKLESAPISDKNIHIWQVFPPYFQRVKGAIANIGRTLFETDRIPHDWVEHCNRMDEIWVPSQFNVESFARSGVARDKLFKIPASLDIDLYDTAAAPLFIAGKASFNFLSIFDWSIRKGWDILIRAFIEEFSNKEDVALIIKTYSSFGISGKQIREQILNYISHGLFRSPENSPSIFIIEKFLSEKEIVQLYRTCHAYVMPSRCEGWGRPYMEAMIMGLPTIGTRWSGNLEFMNDKNSFLIDCEVQDVPETGWREIQTYRGHQWAEPSAAHLKQLMRQVFENRNYASEIGARARKEIREKYNWRTVSEIIADRINTIVRNELGNKNLISSSTTILQPGKISNKEEQTIYKQSKKRFPIIWEGSQFVCHSLALVNRELCSALEQTSECNLSLIPYEKDEPQFFNNKKHYQKLTQLYNKPLNEKVEFYIRHQWPPNFFPPAEGHWILMQPWEFGLIPQNWFKPINENIDEVWAYSTAVKNCYIDSGINPEKVHIIPLGINPSVFHPDVPPLLLKTKKKFKFLFVGGTIWRKGIDILLDVYTKSFRKPDDVCLVIKDIGGESFYKGMNARKRIEEIQKDTNAPEILHLTEIIKEEEIPALYIACNCLVHPYRGEGFGLPVAEAMACGLPVIVTKGGSTDDFCSPDIVYQILSKQVPVTIELPLVGQGWVLEPDARQLQETMLEVYQNPDTAKERSAKASKFIREKFTWNHSAQIVLQRFHESLEIHSKPLRLKSAEKITSVNTTLKVSTDMNTPKTPSTLSEEEIDNYKYLGDAHFKESHYEQALSYYKKVQEVHPDDIGIALKCAEASVRLKEFEQAQKFLEATITAQPNNPDHYNFLAVFLFQQGKYEEAEKQFIKALSLSPDNADTQKNLAELYFRQNRHTEVIPLCKKLLDSDPHNIDTQLLLGNSLTLSGNLTEAKKWYEEVLKEEPDNEDALQNYKIVEDKLKESEKE